MALFAGDNGIMTGDELCYDYNFDSYNSKNVQVCRCGADKCRGVLGPKAKEDRRQKPEQEPVADSTSGLAGAKRKLAQIFDESTSGLSKKRKLVTARVSVVKKATAKSMSQSPKTGINRRPSVLKRIVNGAKDKAVRKRVVSSSSVGEALISRTTARPLSRSESVKAKAQSVRRNVVRTVKGGRRGGNRSIALIAAEEDA